MSEEKRKIVVPGETITTEPGYLPGEGTRKEGNAIIATRFGLADINEKLVRVIPLSGVYMPRKGNTIIGKVIDITFNGWLLDINAPYLAFLPISECPFFIDKTDLTEYFDIGDMIIAKVALVKHRGIDVTVKGRGLGKIKDGLIIIINPSKVPRVIGKGGSMVNLIKNETECNIIVGQNGVVWIKGKSIESELLAAKAIRLVTEKSFIEGLTEMVQEFLNKG